MGDKDSPFSLKTYGSARFCTTCTVIPVAGVGKIAFFPVKMSMNPSSIWIGNTGAEIVGLIPSASSGEPERAHFVG